MYASKEQYRQYLFSDYRTKMSFQDYLARPPVKEIKLQLVDNPTIKEQGADVALEVSPA